MKQTSPDPLYSKLNRKNPAFLFLGQNYLSLDSGRDHFLAEILRKYNNGEEPTDYKQIFLGEAHKSKELTLAWMHERCSRFSPPQWLEIVAKFPWNGVYTSAIDEIWTRAFRSEWREIQPIYDLDFDPSEPRNRSRLHCTFLYGCVNQTEANKTPPLKKLELTRRNQVATNLASKLKELITPLGVFIIEGYAGEKDWFSPESLYPVIDSLNPHQTHLFSATQELRNDEYIVELVNNKKLVLYSDSLENYLLNAEESGLIQLGESTAVEEYGHLITLENESIDIPISVWNQVSRSATILDDSILVEPEYISEDKRYSEFRQFLAESSHSPIWSGYHRRFAFQRDFEVELYNTVQKKLKSKDLHDNPVIIHGQSGIGKSIALGHLAFLIREEKKYPVLFINSKSQNTQVLDIKIFCELMESYAPYTTLVVWDGMLDYEKYYQFSRKLASLGKKALIVGSCYKINTFHENVKDIIEVPSNFNKQSEENKFLEFLGTFDDSLSEQARKIIEKSDSKILVSLYRLLPETRTQISQGLVQEIRYFERGINRQASKTDKSKKGNNTNMALAFAILQDKPEWLEEMVEKAFSIDEKENFSDEEITKVQKLIGLIMIPSKLGLNVPLEILMRSITKEGTIDLINLLNKIDTDIIQWYPDATGNYQIGARHSLEAEEITKSLRGSIRAEVDYAKELLINVRSKGEWDTEIQFAVNFLKNMGPNSPIDPNYYAEYFQDIAKTLKQLRQEHSVIHVRLMLQEAMLLRESATKKSRNLTDSNIVNFDPQIEDMFNEGELVIKQALKLVENNQGNKKIFSILYSELASILGAKFIHILKQDVNNAISYFEQAKEIAFKSLSLDSEEYHPLDVLSWTTEALLKNKKMLSPELIAENTADILQAFTIAEVQNFDQLQQIKFHQRRAIIGDLIEKLEISKDAIQSLMAIKPSAAHYLIAYKMLPKYDILQSNLELSLKQKSQCQQVFDYLYQHYELIRQDGKTLYFLLRVWWLSKTGHNLFYHERQTVPFHRKDWELCLTIIEDARNTQDLQYNSSLKYLLGLCYFHLDRVNESLDVFNELKEDSQKESGSRRVISSYLASTSDGKPKQYNGEVVRRNDKGNKGQVYVKDLRIYVDFIPRIFNRPDIRKGESLGQFHIAFNFRGPIAEPISLYSNKRS